MIIEFEPSLAQVLNLLVAVILPIVVGLVTTRVTSGNRKAILLAALSLITGLLTELLAAVQAGVTYDLATGLVNALATFLIAVALHFGLWKPTGASDIVQSVGGPKHARPDGSYDVSRLPNE